MATYPHPLPPKVSFFIHPLSEIVVPDISNLTIYLSIYRKKANIFNTISQKQMGDFTNRKQKSFETGQNYFFF